MASCLTIGKQFLGFWDRETECWCAYCGAHFKPRFAEGAPEARAAGRVDAQAALQQGQVPFDPSNPHAHSHPPHESRRVQCLRVLDASAKHMGELGERVSLADQYPKLRPPGGLLSWPRPTPRRSDRRSCRQPERGSAPARAPAPPDPKQVARWHGGEGAHETEGVRLERPVAYGRPVRPDAELQVGEEGTCETPLSVRIALDDASWYLQGQTEGVKQLVDFDAPLESAEPLERGLPYACRVRGLDQVNPNPNPCPNQSPTLSPHLSHSRR